MKFPNALRVFLPALLLLLALPSCEIEEQFDLNGPSLNGVLSNASQVELNLLATGIEARMRNSFDVYQSASGTVARELYIFDADPRNTEDLLGKDDVILDDNTFYVTAPFGSRYRVIKNANTLLEAVDNTDQINTAEAAGYRGFANTIKALMLSQVLDLLDENGVRIDVADPENLGPYVSKEEGYDMILALFDEANAQLSGAEFAFTLSTGFTNFATPATFSQVNRALAARVATRAGRYQEALELVEDSFLDLDGDLSTGPNHVFSTAAGDILNPAFKAPGQSGDQWVVNPRIINGLEEGDNRSSKWRQRVQETGQDGLAGNFETALYASATSPMSFIRNEELVLIWAEANLQTGDLDDAERGINIVRTGAGLDDFDDNNDRNELINELLKQRTYSLWGEGHQMFDLRRYGRLNANFLPIDRAGDDIFTQFPIPNSEGV
ncbi:RagB/SusD family nutrient uptake outer membrane protein [Neolewinella antarctica]|uniref:RagB/SusD domain-containing protein n=1 Tax=Neolewinella antarctica TaxID=442734 RepID=A0ABX0XDY3_9BACT|nr:RagB/SusD family nutrient uptake outer membrane protein [Neolewinella antarctica]NJC27519.1 hypothetical protein [Neolewinella antarctica]